MNTTEINALLLAALKGALVPYLNGDCYETKNPYSRPCVRQGLIAIAKAEGKSAFGNDWMDAMDETMLAIRDETKSVAARVPESVTRSYADSIGGCSTQADYEALMDDYDREVAAHAALYTPPETEPTDK